MSESDDRVIRASEIGQYIFCAQAWWLDAVEGLPSANQQEMTAGEAEHRWHGRRVRTSISLGHLATVILLLALLVGIAWAVGLTIE